MDITIKVLGEFDNVQTRIVSDAAPTAVIERQIRQAISSLEAEIIDLRKCPYHSASGAAMTSATGTGT